LVAQAVERSLAQRAAEAERRAGERLDKARLLEPERTSVSDSCQSRSTVTRAHAPRQAEAAAGERLQRELAAHADDAAGRAAQQATRHGLYVHFPVLVDLLGVDTPW
jgi:hypothetical protein